MPFDNQTLHVLRGIPGCGKSTFAKALLDELNLISETAICNTDWFFINRETGEYEFDISLLGKNHAKCFDQFLQLIRQGREHIVLDNTNIEMWECQNYIAVAKMMAYHVEIHEWIPMTLDEFWLCVERQQHGVPAAVMLDMTKRFESAGGWHSGHYQIHPITK